MLIADIGRELGGYGAHGRVSVNMVPQTHASDLSFQGSRDHNDTPGDSMHAGFYQQGSLYL